MSHTQILFRDDARAKLLAGASTLADAVRVTVGKRADMEFVNDRVLVPERVVFESNIAGASFCRFHNPYMK